MATKLAFIGGIAVLFVVTVFILLRIMPGPHRPTDYLVIGTLATFVCLAAFFVLNLITSGKPGEQFYKRRK
jgi:hypothetical protein